MGEKKGVTNSFREGRLANIPLTAKTGGGRRIGLGKTTKGNT